MKINMDLTKEYGLVLDGGGARGAYQIGAWMALKEAGIKICAVAGTSVGALNGALICMDNVKLAKKIWWEMKFSKVMSIDDEYMERFFRKEITKAELLAQIKNNIRDGGIDVTPLKQLIQEVVDEEQIRSQGKELCILTFSLSEWKELDLSIHDIPKGMLSDFLLASAYLLGFKNEKLHGVRYLDGGVINNVPMQSLVERGYKDIIQIRIHGPGREPKIKLAEDMGVYEIGPRVSLGSIIEFHKERSRKNLKIGYLDACRLIYGLTGRIYYVEQTHEECYYIEKLKAFSAVERAELAFVLRCSPRSSASQLYVSMLEGAAKLLKVPKYNIYTVDQLMEKVEKKYWIKKEQLHMPHFVQALMGTRKEEVMNLKGRSFLTLKDFTKEEILYLIDLAADLKAKKKKGITGKSLQGKNIALIFEKPSTRTRCAFTVGAADEGGIPTYLSGNEIQLGHKESIEDTARVLGRMFDGIEFRGFQHAHVEALAKYSGVPVWNGLTDDYHPTQILADFLTMQEQFGQLEGLKFVYLGDGRNNMANSLMIGCAKVGIRCVIIAPKSLWPEESLIKLCQEYGEESGASVLVTEELDGVEGADVLYTDVWCSMGEEEKAAERVALLQPYQINQQLMDRTGKSSTIFMHCLPAVKGKEVTEDVFEGKQSVVFDEAENRMHTIKAVMVATLGNQ